MNDFKAKTLRLVRSNDEAAEMALDVARRRFAKDVALRDLFEPLTDEVKGMGDKVASEVAWKLFVWIDTKMNFNKEK